MSSASVNSSELSKTVVAWHCSIMLISCCVGKPRTEARVLLVIEGACFVVGFRRLVGLEVGVKVVGV